MENDREQVELLLEEFRQTWQHYRHLENARSWYLGFLFTITAGVGGWIARLLGDTKSPTSSNAYFVSLIVVILLGALAIAIFASLVKNRLALLHYGRARRNIRRRIYGTNYEEINRELDVRCDPAIQACRLSAGATALRLIWAIVFTCITYVALGVLHVWVPAPLTIWQRLIGGALLVSLVILSIVTACRAKECRSLHPPNTQPASADRSC